MRLLSIIDDVHRSVLRNGDEFVINSDEISAMVISPTLTLLPPIGGDHPPELRSNKPTRRPSP